MTRNLPLIVILSCLGLWSLGLGACGSTPPGLIASPEDYAQYRRARTKQGLEARLGESWNYLREFPDGAYEKDVRRWFERASGSYLQRFWNDVSHLETYASLTQGSRYAKLVAKRVATLRKRKVPLASPPTPPDPSWLRRTKPGPPNNAAPPSPAAPPSDATPPTGLRSGVPPSSAPLSPAPPSDATSPVPPTPNRVVPTMPAATPSVSVPPINPPAPEKPSK